MTENKKNIGSAKLILAIIIIAFNLRAAITGLGCIASVIQDELSMSSGVFGMITTIPLIAFAVVSPFVSKFAENLGEGRAILMAFITLAVGILIRSYCGVAGLFIGTALLAAGVAFGNVLLPVIISTYFAKSEGVVTGIYSCGMCLFASVSAAVTVPMADSFGWKQSLSSWVILAILAIVFWIPFINMKLNHSHGVEETKQEEKGKFKSSIVIWLSIFMGIQCLYFYSWVAWLPSIIAAKGISFAASGYCYSLFQFAGIPGSLIFPPIAHKCKEEKGTVAVAAILFVLGFILVEISSNTLMIALGCIIAGIASGACFGLGFLLIGGRAKDAKTAVTLSGIVQSAGFIIAAAGPILMGVIYDACASWTIPMVILIILGIPMTIAAWQGGKDRKI